MAVGGREGNKRERTRHIGGEGKREGGRVRQPQGGKASIGKGAGRHGAVEAALLPPRLLLPRLPAGELHDLEMGLGEVGNLEYR